MTALIALLTIVVIFMICLAVCNGGRFKVMLIVIFTLATCVIGFLFSLYLNEKNIKHEAGKDTIEVYGDGTFQISGNKGALPILVDLERHTTLEARIEKYKLIGDTLYIQGGRGYTIVNIKSEVIKQYVLHSENDYWEKNERPKYGEKYIRLNALDDFSLEEKKIFNKM